MSLAVPIQESISPQNLQQTAVDTLSSHTGSNGPSLAAQSAPRQNSQGSLAAGVPPSRTKLGNLVAGIARPTAGVLKFGPLQDLSDLIKDFASMHVGRYKTYASSSNRSLSRYENKQGGKQLGRLLAANEEEEKLAACCRRVQNYLDQLLLDNTLAIHKMEEEQSKARIGRLPSSPSAWYDSNAGRSSIAGVYPRNSGHRWKNTEWTRKKHEGGVYWLNGMAGTGKTTIAYSVQRARCRKQASSQFLLLSTAGCDCLPACALLPSIPERPVVNFGRG
ncbi:hypothetical protein OPQ81_003769 [Rhizoctonia solani]|nr:hypothetical protein OPQ81_003769 [Rhizoctonia solani]